MKNLATPEFWQCYNALPKRVQLLADKSYAQLRTDPRHPSLQLKKIGEAWSARVGLHYRALAYENAHGDLVWFWIGIHANYDKKIS